MSQLALTNFINISVSEPQAGIGNYNTSNLGLFTHEVPGMTFGDDGFKQYIDPVDVATDFGTESKTYKMALAVFSQQPNILTGGGQLVVVLMNGATAPITAVQRVQFSTVPTSGSYELGYNGNYTAAIAFDDDAPAVQVALRLVSGLSAVTVTGSTTDGFVVVFTGILGPALLLTVQDNSLQDTDSFNVAVTPETTTVGVIEADAETLAQAIARTKDLVQYFGVMESATATEQTEANVLAAAAVIQALNKIAFFVSYDEADIQSAGILDLLRTGNLTQSRGLYYGDDTTDVAIVMMASYAGRGLSVNFSGSNTTITMNFKDLSGVQPDPSMTQTIYNEAKAAGADIYASIQGVPKVVCFGANKFFDQVYNLQWFVGALQVAGFNFLAEASTKIPQTESGMDGLKGAYRVVCEQGITNQYGAPGSWTSSTVFGVPADLIANVAQRGYYIFSIPIAQQSQIDRAARKAPLVQIAFKEAGAIQESDVIVNVNA